MAAIWKMRCNNYLEARKPLKKLWFSVIVWNMFLEIQITGVQWDI